ncbi:MAG: Mur ligase domain-containing protein, partial [Limnochordia bacterium]
MNQRIHFIGIGGTGMGPLAKIFLEMGWQVSGSDLKMSETTEYLERLGARISLGHKAE